MSFEIAFYAGPVIYPYDNESVPAADGYLQLGDSEEGFQSSLFQWSKLDYENQWRYAVQAILDGADRAALIVEYVSPEFASNLEWWPMYRVGDIVYFHNQILFYDRLKTTFSMESAFSFVDDRITHTEDGIPISEWCVSVADLEAFIAMPWRS